MCPAKVEMDVLLSVNAIVVCFSIQTRLAHTEFAHLALGAAAAND